MLFKSIHSTLIYSFFFDSVNILSNSFRIYLFILHLDLLCSVQCLIDRGRILLFFILYSSNTGDSPPLFFFVCSWTSIFHFFFQLIIIILPSCLPSNIVWPNFSCEWMFLCIAAACRELIIMFFVYPLVFSRTTYWKSIFKIFLLSIPIYWRININVGKIIEN